MSAFICFVCIMFSVSGFLPSAVQCRKQTQLPPTPSTTLKALNAETAAQLAVGVTLAIVTDPIEGLLFNETDIWRGKDSDSFLSTFLYSGIDSITVASRVYVILLLIGVAVYRLDISLPIDVDLRFAAPKVAATVWAALTISTAKRTFFSRSIDGRKLGRIELYDKLLDFLIGLVVATFLIDDFNVDVGMGLKSLLSGGGIIALGFSLASKDLAENIVGGLVVQSWNAFKKGDYILLGDGTYGTVSQVGLVETELIGDDNVAIKIPNKDMVSQRVSNLSRTQLSRVFQTIRFQYSDLDKLPNVLNDIKSEIKTSCPSVILDGSKPFQALLSAYKEDHVEAIVNVHFNIPPATNEFANNRQQVLLAVARALRKNDVQVALPGAIVYQNEIMKGIS